MAAMVAHSLCGWRPFTASWLRRGGWVPVVLFMWWWPGGPTDKGAPTHVYASSADTCIGDCMEITGSTAPGQTYPGPEVALWDSLGRTTWDTIWSMPIIDNVFYVPLVRVGAPQSQDPEAPPPESEERTMNDQREE